MIGSREVKIDITGLRGKSVMVATPMYGGLGGTMYIMSMLRLQAMCIDAGVRFEFCFMSNESLIDRARNGLVSEFLTQSRSDYMLFIDADIEFRPEDVLAMMTYDKDIICGPYPKKRINWPVIVEAIKQGEDNEEHLERLVGEYVFTPLDESAKPGEIIRVAEAGTGMMLIKRSVFQKMQEAFPDNSYVSDDSRFLATGIKKKMHAFFRTAIRDGRYLSEDYYFCQKWRDMGGDVWLFPWALTTHYGTYGFKGSVGHLMYVSNKIKKEGKDG